ncbi:MAG: VanZ family protein [bacterium]
MINWLEKYNKLSWGITIFGAVMIFYLSSIKMFGLGEKGTNLISMIYHICAFFCFSFFLFISVRKINHIFVLAIIVSIFYAVLDEIHQIFVPGRFCTFLDFALDSVGILLASVIYLSVKYRRIQNV